MTHPALTHVTNRIIERSEPTRAAYLARMREMASQKPHRMELGCGNLAHGFAACNAEEKADLRGERKPNIAIVSAYNDMLSAHHPYEHYPAIIRDEARKAGAVAQFAGGVPAMCDGVTQGMPGMELSLFSRDTIAMATAIALTHNMFDGALMLGICDKIVPGLLIGALQFAHLPVIFVPGGPMPSGLPNKEKARIRQLFAKGEIGREGLLEAESASYHSPGTCTFYGTANSNQMLMEVMGLQLPSSSFVNPGTELREALTREAVRQVIALTAQAGNYTPLCEVIDERSIVNGIVGLHATGGSTNHTIHLIAIARAAGIIIDWDDLSELSKAVPLLCRIYPNGEADVNHFHAAGGMSKLVRDLLSEGLLHGDAGTITGQKLTSYTQEPYLKAPPSWEGDQNMPPHQPSSAARMYAGSPTSGEHISQAVAGVHVAWHEGPKTSGDATVLADIASPFSREGGLTLLKGNLGRAVIKTSAVKPEHRIVHAPAKVFTSQEALQQAFKNGELGGDFVAVVTWQGPSANGMPELHRLTPPLSVLQDLGQKVALVTDGRMSGASGKVPAAIHVSPECKLGGALAKVRDGDMILLDAGRGILMAEVDEVEFNAREVIMPDLSHNEYGLGRELFASARRAVTPAEEGASFVV